MQSTSNRPLGTIADADMYLIGSRASQQTTATPFTHQPTPSPDPETATLAPSQSNGDGSDKETKAGSDAKAGNTLRRHMTEADVSQLTRELSRHLSRSQTSLANPDSENFELETFLRQVFQEYDQNGIEMRKTNVVFENLSVDGIGSGVTFGETVGSILTKPFSILRNISQFRRKHLKHILHSFTGTVEPGEMLLVLGRPGAGCSSLLKTLANNTGSFSNIDGEVTYSGISQAEMIKRFAGDVAYLPEDDIHLPVLTVDQTLNFATASRAPAAQGRLGSRADYIKTVKAVQLTIFGLRNTVNTKVGGDYVRGISGGQRKRVSIAELMVTRAKVACHDNSTRVRHSASVCPQQQLNIIFIGSRRLDIVGICSLLAHCCGHHESDDDREHLSGS